MTAPVLRLEQVSRRYGAVNALHPISLDITTGARHAIIGPNGAGKSTLLHLIAGNLAASTGQILLDSRPVTRAGPATRAGIGIGRTFQHPAVVDELTAADNVSLAIRSGRARRDRRGERTAQITAALDRVGVAGEADVLAGQLPYGRRRLLEFAMVLAARPRLVLLDEPSAGLDPAEIRHLATILHRLPADTAVILVDHHLPLVWDVADTVTVLASGQHIATGPTARIRADQTVRDVYTGTPTRPTVTVAVAAAGPDVLAVEQLRAGYHGAPVLHDVALTVAAGTVHALLGRNGAGKSTLINVIAGLHPAHPGTRLWLHGQPRQPGRPGRPGVALVPQGRRLWPSLTVAEHLRLAAAGSPPVTAGAPRWDVTAVLELFPALRDKQRRYPHQMSGGEQQMLALARALLHQPALLLLDEPSEGLAPQLVDQLAAAIRRIADSGAAVLLAEQNQHLAASVADQTSVLAAGRIALSTTRLDQPATHTRLAELLGVATAGDGT